MRILWIESLCAILLLKRRLASSLELPLLVLGLVVHSPNDVLRIMRSISFAVSIGVNDVGSLLECLNYEGYLASLLFYMFTPMVVAALIVLRGLGRLYLAQSLTADALQLQTVPYLLQLMFLACNSPQGLGLWPSTSSGLGSRLGS